MQMNTNRSILIIPEGPLARDSHGQISNSIGEGQYIDAICKQFNTVHVVSYTFSEDNPWFSSCSGYTSSSTNLFYHTLPSSSNIFLKLVNTLRLCLLGISVSFRVSHVYFFIPGIPSVLIFFIGLFFLPFRRCALYMASRMHSDELNVIYSAQPSVVRYFVGKIFSLSEYIMFKCSSPVHYTDPSITKYRHRHASATIPRSDFSHLFHQETCDQIPSAKYSINLIYIGMLSRRKNALMLLQISRDLKRLGLSFHLNIVGDGSLYSIIKESVAKENLPITLHGFVSDRAYLSSLLRQADIMVFPSGNEGFPRVFIEAYISRTAVVCFSLEGLSRFSFMNTAYVCKNYDDMLVSIISISNTIFEGTYIRRSCPELDHLVPLLHDPYSQYDQQVSSLYS